MTIMNELSLALEENDNLVKDIKRLKEENRQLEDTINGAIQVVSRMNEKIKFTTEQLNQAIRRLNEKD